MPRAKKLATDEPAPPTMRELARAVDKLYEIKHQRLAAQKEVDKLQKIETELSDMLIKYLPVSDTSGIAGHVARAQIVPSTVPQVEDWEAFYGYVRKKKNFGLLQRRVSIKAIEELWEDKQVVPGVVRFNIKKVSLTKV